MNVDHPKPGSWRRLAGPAVLVLLLVIWTMYWHYAWVRPLGVRSCFGEIDLMVFVIGLVIVLVGNVLVRLVWGLFKHGWRWLIGREALRSCLWSAVLIVSALVLFYNYQWWHGKRAWARVAQQAKQQGEALTDLSTLLKEPVPDNENFAKAPPFDPLFARSITSDGNGNLTDTGTNRAAFAAMWVENWYPGVKQLAWVNGERTDLRLRLGQCRRWESAFSTGAANLAPSASAAAHLNPTQAAEQMLISLALFDDAIRQLREHSARPVCQFPVEYWDFRRRGVQMLNGFIRVLCLRASAKLTLGRADAAFADVELALRLGEYTCQQGSFLAPIVWGDMVQPIWEGLASRQWNDAQLRALQDRLIRRDILNDYPAAWRVEATWMADYLEAVIPTGRPTLTSRTAEQNDLQDFPPIRLIVPAGWSMRGQAIIHSVRLRAIAEFNRSTHPHPLPVSTGVRDILQDSDIMSQTMIVPHLRYVWLHAASFFFAQSAVDQTALACALERYRLANGQYPETLDMLAPNFIAAPPPDVITGTPLKYRRLANDRFLLYSVGVNQTDDAGQPSPRGLNWDQTPHYEPDLREGDWVWTYPPGK